MLDHASMKSVSSNPQADYTGTWSIQMPEFGLFQLYIDRRDGKRVEGHITDRLGRAKFTGTFRKDRVKFVKRYIEVYPGNLLKPISGDIPYEGIVSKDKDGIPIIFGYYCQDSDIGVIKRRFIMWPYHDI